MTKTKVASRRPVVVEAREPEAPDAWRRRQGAPVLIVAILIAAVLGTGLAMDKALEPQIPAALAGCNTSTQLGPHDFIGPQPICITANHSYEATVNTTQGPFVIHLHPEIAPVTVNNFIVLAIHGYYDHLTFWKSEDWVVQTGDPGGDGRGGPGYGLREEPNVNPPWGWRQSEWPASRTAL